YHFLWRISPYESDFLKNAALSNRSSLNRRSFDNHGLSVLSLNGMLCHHIQLQAYTREVPDQFYICNRELAFSRHSRYITWPHIIVVHSDFHPYSAHYLLLL